MHKRKLLVILLFTFIELSGCGNNEEEIVQPIISTESTDVNDVKYELVEPETEVSVETDNYSSYSQLNKLINKITRETE